MSDFVLNPGQKKKDRKKKRAAKPFKFRIYEEGKVYSLPNLQTLSLGVQQEVARTMLNVKGKKQKEAQTAAAMKLTDVLMEVIRSNEPELMNELSEADELKALFEGWFAHSGITPGESSGSA